MTPRKLLLIGWDAADWKVIRPLIGEGKMPHLQRLVETGASAPIATLHPALSPMLWTSIATGKRPFHHGIHGFSEPAPDGSGVQPVSNLSRTSKALWNIFNQNALRSIVVGWWPSHPAEPIDGAMLSDHFHRAYAPLEEAWPLQPDSVYPPELAPIIEKLRVHPEQITPEMVERFIPLAREIDQDQDHRLAALLRILAECGSVHAASLWLIENQPWDFFAVYHDSIDHASHAFMKYHPPRQARVSERDFALYQSVVSTTYRLHDEMLGELLRKAGDGVTVMVLSDHGFHPDHLRPASIPDVPAGPAVEHRDFGIFTVHGPGIKAGELLQGVSLLDVTPTILSLYGLPVGEDMEGAVLSQAFLDPPRLELIPSWENVPGRDGRHPAHPRLDPGGTGIALDQLIALGYIRAPEPEHRAAIARTARELRFNLGEAYQDASRHREAFEIFSELANADPAEVRFALRLFISSQALGRTNEMRRIVAHLDGRAPALIIEYLNAQVLIAAKQYDLALDALGRITEAGVSLPGPLLQKAELYLKLRNLRSAHAVYTKVLATDPDNAHAILGLGRVALERRKYREAANTALDALHRAPHEPRAHFILGVALARMKDNARAADAFRAALAANPNFPEAHTRLARLLAPEAAREHKTLARQIKRRPAPKPGPAPRTQAPAESAKLPASDSLIVVTGLPRSGTSMLMQMLDAAGIEILTDHLRAPDPDNPRGYLEYEPVKNLHNEAAWLADVQRKAIKIVIPLLFAIPAGVPCRVILVERDLDEILDSQERMLRRLDPALAATPGRRLALRNEYRRYLDRAKAMLASRPQTQWLVIENRDTLAHPELTAERLNAFLGGHLDEAPMAAAIDVNHVRRD